MTDLADLYTPVAAPTVPPRPFGLFSVVTPTSPPDPHWSAGISWTSVSCIDANAWVDECITGTVQNPTSKVLSRCDDEFLGQYKPITAYVALQRSAMVKDVEVMAASALTLGEQAAVEAGLWALLVIAAGVPSTGGNAIEALAQVEQALAENYHGLGVIHMTPATAIRIGTGHLIASGGKLTTLLGTPVSVGAGYAKASNSIIGSGVLNAFRSTTDTFTSFDRSVNDQVTLVERTYVVGWDCFVTAAALTP